MALADYAAYLTAKQNARTYPFMKNLSTAADGIYCDWSAAPSGGALLAGATAAPLPSTVGTWIHHPHLLSAYTDQLYLGGVDISSGYNSGGMAICDMLVAAGEYPANIATTQTTPMPTAALTRYTGADSKGNMIGLMITTQIGATATTVTCSYTNQAGTAGRTTQAAEFGGAANRDVGKMIVLPFQDGDSGVRSVESVTLAATTGTAGGFDVWIFRPLVVIPTLSVDNTSLQSMIQWDPLIGGGGQMTPIMDGACLCMVRYTTGQSQWVQGVAYFIEVA